MDAGTRKALIATSEKQLLDRHTSGILDKVQLTTEFVPLVIGVVDIYCEYAIVYLAGHYLKTWVPLQGFLYV